ncbi:MAG: hypothetical protein LBR08_01600 [Bacteroidales bacterium]|jgi:hypothetical protein|nr:hypothetical protein [Bacteroidales bacterium]
MEDETIRKKIATMLPVLDEKQTRLYLASEANSDSLNFVHMKEWWQKQPKLCPLHHNLAKDKAENDYLCCPQLVWDVSLGRDAQF